MMKSYTEGNSVRFRDPIEEASVVSVESYCSSSDEEAPSWDEESVQKKDETNEANQDSRSNEGFFARRARAMARTPWIHLAVAFVIAIVISVLGIIVGDFQVSADNSGWQTRGTLIADRHTQVLLVLLNRNRLFYEGSEAWDDLINNIQSGWETYDDDDGGRMLSSVARSEVAFQPTELDGNRQSYTQERPFVMSDEFSQRHLQEATGGLEGCDVRWYSSGRMMVDAHLWPVWQTNDLSTSALDPQVVRDICIAEEATQEVLQADGLCYGCSDGQCLPPYSLVFFARLTVRDIGFNLTCDELSTRWGDYIDEIESDLEACVADIKQGYKEGEPLPESCPFGFTPSLLDEFFGVDNNEIRYTSSIFATIEDTEELYEKVSEFDRASSSAVVEGVYDTQYEDFVGYKLDDSLVNDMILALGSAGITALAILIHTRSPWLTLVGLLQIILSFPIAYFVYKLIGRLQFFPFLNFLGIFVVFALGADDIFVAVDKWKNARLEDRNASTEDIAAVALPDAAGAMFLTTITTAVAFFATAICKVAPLKAFAIFCGLLVTIDYIMCVSLVFPALCIYDRSLISGKKNCCISCHCCSRFEAHGSYEHGEEEKPSLIRRILLGYYKVMHFFRWPLLLACIAGLVVSAVYASRLTLPTSSDVRLLDESYEFEKAYLWRLNLLSEVLSKEGGSQGYVMWGVQPADNGKHMDPDNWSSLVLDESFDPSSEAAQEYLAGFCDDFFSNDFADKTSTDYVCAINAFDNWLQEQASAELTWDAYSTNCGNATAVPVPQEHFDACIIGWSQLVGDARILQRNGKVQIMYDSFQSRVRYDSPFADLNREWHDLESWMAGKGANATAGVANMYFSSDDFWWYDTNQNMLATAYGAAAIALAAAAVVMLISSRSFILTCFAIFTIGFILTSVTAMLVAAGWTLGFLESICFAIAIGISCDFVIHFAHAYSTPEGDVNRSERTKFALVHMGPSILMAATTTIGSAVVMVFTVITFFQKFAVVLFFTILMATVGAFVVFITLADCIGPSRPTYLVDLCTKKLKSCCCKKRGKEDDNTEESSDGS